MSDAEQVKAAFKQADNNADGIISRTEMEGLFRKLGMNLSDPEADALFQAADTNGDGLIKYEEFVDWLFSMLPGGAATTIKGRYEVKGYEGQRNDWHYVTIRQVEHSTFEWCNRANVSWILKPTSDPSVYEVGADCPYYNSGCRELKAVFDKESGRVDYVEGPGGEPYMYKGPLGDMEDALAAWWQACEGGQDHADVLKNTFAFQGYIEDTAERGITAAQLQDIKHFATAHCGSWVETATFLPTCGQPLSIGILNLYHLNSWLIMPATKDVGPPRGGGKRCTDCAFVELLAPGGRRQRPNWFISHWWGEIIVDFIACVVEHVRLRGLSLVDTAYWVCAYANRQHSLSNELVADPKQTSFHRALQLSIGVLLILDQENSELGIGPATPFTRIWCAFEESVALSDSDRKQPMKLDIATNDKAAGPQILTDGFCHEDQEHAAHKAAFYAPGQQSLRQAKFPIGILKTGLQLQLEKAQATQAIDKVRILNCIAERDLHDVALEEHANYDRVNKALRSRFAVSGWRRAVEGGVVEDLGFPQVLTEDAGRQVLQLNFESCGAFDDAALGQLAGSFQGLALLGDLNLEFQGCESLRSLDALGEGLSHCGQLRTLYIGIARCDLVANGLGPGIAHCGLLRECFLNAWGSNSADSSRYDEFWDGLSQCPSLEEFQVNFDNAQFTDAGALGRSVGGMGKLKRVTFHLTNAQIPSFDTLAESIPRCPQLENLELRTDGNQALGSLDSLGAGIEQCCSLNRVHLDIRNANPGVSLGSLAAGLSAGKVRSTQIRHSGDIDLAAFQGIRGVQLTG